MRLAASIADRPPVGCFVAWDAPWRLCDNCRMRWRTILGAKSFPVRSAVSVQLFGMLICLTLLSGCAVSGSVEQPGSRPWTKMSSRFTEQKSRRTGAIFGNLVAEFGTHAQAGLTVGLNVAQVGQVKVILLPGSMLLMSHTNGDGSFRISAVPAGRYIVRARAAGRQCTPERRQITVLPRKMRRLDVTCYRGAAGGARLYKKVLTVIMLSVR